MNFCPYEGLRAPLKGDHRIPFKGLVVLIYGRLRVDVKGVGLR